MRGLIIQLSPETSESPEKISIVTQKTVTNSDVIILDKLFSGKAAYISSLVIKLDPAEGESDRHL